MAEHAPYEVKKQNYGHAVNGQRCIIDLLFLCYMNKYLVYNPVSKKSLEVFNLLWTLFLLQQSIARKHATNSRISLDSFDWSL